MRITLLFVFSLFMQVAASGQNTKKYATQNVIVLVMDGPRYLETWGDSTHQFIPKMANDMAKTGVVFTNFYNDGYTYTSSGHTAICTGHRQELENKKGTQLPDYPSFLQYYLKKSNHDSTKAFIVTSKDKLHVLGNSNHPDFHNQYLPTTLCGNSGVGSGFCDDTTTLKRTINVLKTYQPQVVLVNFKEPDVSGHANDWPNYLKGIKKTDSLIWEVWNYIQQDEFYKNKTTLFVTNDHGRHTTGHKDGFVNHGDTCDGCRHINLFAFGPDFKQNKIENGRFIQVDITATIAELLGIEMPYGQGKVIRSLFLK